MALKGPDSFVELLENLGEWHVRVVENGIEAGVACFEIEAHARSYADGQRIRLRIMADAEASR